MGKWPTARRLSSGVDGLDAMLGGGYLEGDSTLVAGSPGTGKTTLGMHFIAAGVANNEPGVFVTFEYLPQQLYRDAEKKGWPLKQWDEEGKVRVVCTTPDILMAAVEGDRSLLDDTMNEIGARRLVIDSMSHFEFVGRPRGDLRTHITGLMNHLRILGVTAMVTHELPQIVGPTVHISNYGLEFLVDNILLLRYVELEGELQKAVAILKFRGGQHDRRYRVLELTGEGAVIQADFAGVEGISGGTARRSLAERARQII